MAVCLGCHGDGRHDFADMDAYLEEHLNDAALERAKALSSAPWRGYVICDECEGTGVTTEDRRKDMLASALAAVDQIIAKVAEEEARA